MTSVSAVVVHYRGGALLDRCVRSCLSASGIEEVVVVDNEGTAPLLRERQADPRVRVLAMASNVGYGRGANAGLDAATGEAALVLNQDVVIPPGAPTALLGVAEASAAWVVGPRLEDAVGGVAPLKVRFPPPLSWPGSHVTGRGWRAVPWVAGAAMLLPPGTTHLRFDPRLFMYGEDEELCWRVWRDGGRVVLAEDVPVRHEGGTATGTRWSRRQVVARTIWNRARFVRWHAGIAGVGSFVASEALGRAARSRSVAASQSGHLGSQPDHPEGADPR